MNLFIISYNRLTFLQQQIEFMRTVPRLHIHIVDNASTYPPLLEYLKSIEMEFGITVHYMEKNYGHTVIFDTKIARDLCPDEPYMITDNDILPDNIRFADLLIDGLRNFPLVNKIGLGLCVHGLPDNPLNQKVIEHECNGLSRAETQDPRFIRMAVDTTLAIYRAGYFDYSPWGGNFYQDKIPVRSLRTTQMPAKHLSWYLTDEELQSEENKFYFKSLKEGSSHWSHIQARTLKRKI